VILKDLIPLLKKGEDVLCPSCKKGFIKPVNVSGKKIDISELHLFKCTNCDYYIEAIPKTMIIE
jgi:hypothetical protein